MKQSCLETPVSKWRVRWEIIELDGFSSHGGADHQQTQLRIYILVTIDGFDK